MSHVAKVDVEILNLDWLAQACQRLGLELLRDQKRFFAFRDRKCDHAIRVAGLTGQAALDKVSRTYEIGVLASKDGQPGYSLSFDLFMGGNGLQKRVGDKCQRLAQAYTAVATRETARRQGMRVREQQLEDGSIRLVLET